MDMPNDFLEKTLEDIIIENKDVIHQRGLPKFKDKTFRQVILPSGKKIDALSFSIQAGKLDFVIYELKRDYINLEAVCQAYNYFEEIRCLIGNNFSSYCASIIMVGRRYEHIPILNGMSIPIMIYTYDYKMNGISFQNVTKNPSTFPPNDLFSMGLWAFGCGGLHYDSQPSSMNFQDVYFNYKKDNPGYDDQLKHKKALFFNEQKLLTASTSFFIEESKPPKRTPVITEVFPEQPGWSKDFLAGITFNDIFEDIEIDRSDYEPEEQDNDDCDREFEHEGDNGDDEKWRQNVNVFEPVYHTMEIVKAD